MNLQLFLPISKSKPLYNKKHHGHRLPYAYRNLDGKGNNVDKMLHPCLYCTPTIFCAL